MLWCIRWIRMISFTVSGEYLNSFKLLICKVAVYIFIVPLRILLRSPFECFFSFVLPKWRVREAPRWACEEDRQCLSIPFCLLACTQPYSVHISSSSSVWPIQSAYPVLVHVLQVFPCQIKTLLFLSPFLVCSFSVSQIFLLCSALGLGNALDILILAMLFFECFSVVFLTHGVE